MIFFARIFLKTAGIQPGPFMNLKRQVIEAIFNLTDNLVNPINLLLVKLQMYLPVSFQKFFPVIIAENTGGRLEWAALISLFIVISIGLLLEHFASVASEYEKAFINVLKQGPANTQNGNGRGPHANKQLKKIKAENTTTNPSKKKEADLRNVYNLIIRRLDREKTELVNKNITLEKALITDTLTGLKTRKYLNERLKHEFHTAKIRKSDLSVIMLDIDHFKSVNDKYGHQTGDMVLKEVSQIVLNACDVSMVAARYGGEEITVICPKCPSEQGVILAEKIRSQIEHQLRYDSGNCSPVTISAGVASYSSEKSPEELVKNADEALYKAKNEGRNKVVLYNY
jgi:diguanylate cyclase (GGDEF)-like protein